MTGTITFKVFGPEADGAGNVYDGWHDRRDRDRFRQRCLCSVGWLYADGCGHVLVVRLPDGGDANDAASASACGSGLPRRSLGTATTTTSASGPGSGAAGSAIAASAISASRSGGTSGVTGTITFKVFGPQATAPATCTTGGTTVGTATVSGNGAYAPSAGYTPTAAGTYWR